MSAPPAYQAVSSDAPPPEPDADLAAPFANLSIDSLPRDPSPDICLAHLKLLFAFESLKEDVGYTDGLFGIWDSRADRNMEVREDGEEHPFYEGYAPDVDDKKKFLSKIREKRFALFIARAVDRYEAWWNTFRDQAPLTEADMADHGSLSFDYFSIVEDFSWWEKRPLPPLDVLMVFHSHLLNPYNFFEDCLRKGLRRFWQVGLPWSLVDAAIDGSFNYNVSDEDKARWVEQTGHQWENSEDPLVKTLKCPVNNCGHEFEVPWTTCGLDETTKTDARPGFVGFGYGDGKLDARCPSCRTRITRDFLSVAKFCEDANHLVLKRQPMPGTLLWPPSGTPIRYAKVGKEKFDQRKFPNRMIQHVLRTQIQALLDPREPENPPTMETVRKMIENDALLKQSALATILDTSSSKNLTIPQKSRMCIRKMMSRYWDNPSPFALDLCGAVMRQCIFTEKMCKLDWLHSPTARETMGRLCVKYGRFMMILSKNPRKMAVPTLDVDLAWHTHQLAPVRYYKYTTKLARRFIGHDDKIEDERLNEGFEWTSKIYQDLFEEVYSECTCWYCESVRASHGSSLGKILKVSQSEKLADKFYDSGAANMCPPDNSAHISSHNAVRTVDEAMVASNQAEKVQNRFRQLQQKRLEENYQKACKRAEKKGRKLPPKQDYYTHWGYSYYMYGPYMHPVYLATPMYGYPMAGAGHPSCAAGSCGGAGGDGGGDGGGGCGGGGCGGGGCGGGGCGGGGGGCGGGGT
ncbi:hypothetical protein F66182_4479 [Fusarium sp. NRRL 66182]|nr:hypothetical protein F66182_4479 [Fusarium sp. NRRL 66182]